MSAPENQPGLALVAVLEKIRSGLRRNWLSRWLRSGSGAETVLQSGEAVLQDLRGLASRQAETTAEHQRILHNLNNILMQHEQRLHGWDEARKALGILSGQVSALAALAPVMQSDLTQLSVQHSALEAALRTQTASAATAMTELRRQIAGLQAQLDFLLREHGPAQAELSRLAAIGTALEVTLRTHTASAEKDTDNLNRQLAASQAQLDLLLRERGPDRKEEFARFYLAFENEFRGSREEITARQKIYLPHVTAALMRTGGKTWVDLGCGRGEWLEMVRDQGATVLGVDDNSAMLQACQARGLTALNSDALEFLEQTTAGSLGGISAFHLIEHLPYRTMLALINSAWTALAPGGCLLLETPNPQNVSVGACNFYMDVTHRHPIPPMTGEFIARQAGFSAVTVLRLHPSERHAERDSLPTVTEREYCEMFYGPQDYAIIAIK